jgi:hypothetical protein
MLTPAIFSESLWRTIQAWGYHGYLPKRKTSTAQNQPQMQGDNIQNNHAQLSQMLHSSEPLSHACAGSLFQWVQLVSLLWILFLASCM